MRDHRQDRKRRCGLDGGEPNMVCVTFGTPAAIRIDDCGLRQAIWLAATRS